MREKSLGASQADPDTQDRRYETELYCRLPDVPSIRAQNYPETNKKGYGNARETGSKI